MKKGTKSKIFVVAPHVCLHGTDDPACDKSTDRIAKLLGSALPDAVMLSNKQPRSVGDQNRAEGYHFQMRTNLRDQAGRGDCVLEIHSFHNDDAFGGVQSSTEIVLLATHAVGKLSNFEARLVNVLSNTKVVQGDILINDIAKEARERGWNHALLEFRDNLTHEQLNRHIEEIASLYRQQEIKI